MRFLDSMTPIATCDTVGCDGCAVAGSVRCHFGPGDLIHFYLMSVPTFLVAVPGGLPGA